MHVTIYGLVTVAEYGIDGIQLFTNQDERDNALRMFLVDILQEFDIGSGEWSCYEDVLALWYEVRSEVYEDFEVFEREIPVTDHDLIYSA